MERRTLKSIGFEGKVAVVTGAGNGLGRAHALELARRGAKVVVNDLGGSGEGEGASREPADTVVEEIQALGGVAVANHDNVATPDGGRQIVQTALDNFGTVDILVNNAGIGRNTAFGQEDLDHYQLSNAVNHFGCVFTTHAAWPIMQKKKYGRIVHTSSGGGIWGHPGLSAYGAAKMATIGLTNVLALEGAEDNIKVNAIAPVAQTRLSGSLFDPETEIRIMRPELVTPLVLVLVSENCPGTGDAYTVSCGRYARIRSMEAKGVQFDPRDEVTAEDVAARIDDIRDMSDAKLINGSPEARATMVASLHAAIGDDAIKLFEEIAARQAQNKE